MKYSFYNPFRCPARTPNLPSEKYRGFLFADRQFDACRHRRFIRPDASLAHHQRGRAGGSVTTTQAVQLINHEDAVIVDVRPLASFQNGHIPHSRNIPLAEISEKAAKLPKDKPILVTCDRGQIAVGGAARLRKAGLDRVMVIEGGLNAWIQAGLPTSTKKK